MVQKKVLVVEDEAAIREFVVLNLQRSGFEVVEADCAEAGLDLFEQASGTFAVALLDIMLPGEMDGLELCKRLRAKSPLLGIVMLTAKTQETDKITGLTTGADDYVTKPFSPSELVARVEALYRRVELMDRSRAEMPAVYESGPFRLDLSARILTKNGEPILLTQVEFHIVEFFMKNPGTAFDRTTILHTVWGKSYVGDIKVVDVNIRRLRMKLEDDPSQPQYLMTVWGYGYKWKG